MTTNAPWVVRKGCMYYARLETPTEMGKGVCGAIVGTFNVICKVIMKPEYSPGLITYARHLMWGWLFTPDDKPLTLIASEEMTPQMWNGLYRWMGGDWHKQGQRPEFQAEARWVLNCALVNQKDAFACKQFNLTETMSFYIQRWKLLEEQGGDLCVAMPVNDVKVLDIISERITENAK